MGGERKKSEHPNKRWKSFGLREYEVSGKFCFPFFIINICHSIGHAPSTRCTISSGSTMGADEVVRRPRKPDIAAWSPCLARRARAKSK